MKSIRSALARIFVAAFLAFALAAWLTTPGEAQATTSISNTNVALTFLTTLSKTLNLPGATLSNPIVYNKSISFTDGTGNGQADIVWSDTRTLSASSSENLDLNGTLTDAFGGTLTLSAVKILVIAASSSNTNDVLVGGAGSNAFYSFLDANTSYVHVQPGGFFVAVAPNTGYAVTAGTGDLLKVANGSSGSSVTYDVAVLGVE